MSAAEADLSLRLQDSKQALEEIRRGNARGSDVLGSLPLYGRAVVEKGFELLATVYTLFPPFVAIILLSSVILASAALCIGLKRADLETEVAELWIEAGGRLDKEIDYSDAHVDDGFTASSEVVIQLTRDSNFSASLYDHLRLLRAVTNMVVEMDSVTYKYRDLCTSARLVTPSVPELNRIAADLLPCQIFTPLDCYWEGSFLQEPDVPIAPPIFCPNDPNVTWSNLDIPALVECLGSDNTSGYSFFVNQTVVSLQIEGYFNRKCFTMDPGCPTAVADPVQNELVNGCRGFSGLIYEPVPLIIGGGDFERGVPNAKPEALRSVILLNGPAKIKEDLLQYRGINVTEAQIERVLTRWREDFFQFVINFNEKDGDVIRMSSDLVYGFTSETVDNLGEEFSEASVHLVLIGYLLMIIYCALAFFSFDWVRSHSSVGLMGLLLVALASGAALGITSAFGVSFNITTTQIYPFLVLGLGVDDMFVIADAFFEIQHHRGKETDIKDLMKSTMRAVGPSITLTSLTNAAGFLLAAVIPIPAIRNFSIQVGTAVIFNYIALLVGLPSFLVLDHLRAQHGLVDFFCCFPSSLCFHFNKSKSVELKTEKEKAEEKQTEEKKNDWSFSDMLQKYNSILTFFVVKFYSPLLQNYVVKLIVLALFTIWLGFCIWGCTLVEDGLNLDDIVPEGTPEHGFVSTNVRYFAAYSLNVVTRDINYTDPDVQLALVRMSEEVKQANYIVQAGGITEYWLTAMIRYFQGIRTLFCEVIPPVDRGSPLYRDLFGVLLFINQALDSTLRANPLALGKVAACDFDFLMHRTVNGTVHDYIPPDLFYQYLILWVSLDTTPYALSSPSFDPRPVEGSIQTFAMTGVPDYGPILYAEHFLFCEDLRETDDFRTFINDFRDILGRYKSDGIESYPSGTPFLFWEQYINLRSNVGLACGLILIACLLATSFFLMDLWSGVMLTIMLAIIATEVFGVTGFLDIKFSSLPAVMIIASVGVSVEFTAPLTFYFLKAACEPGQKELDLLVTKVKHPKFLVRWFETRNERMHKALEHRFTPIFNGTITTFLGIIMLVFAPLPFIRQYFFSVLFSIVVLGALNGLVLLPVLLSLIGPPAQVYPLKKGEDNNGTPMNALNETFEEVSESRTSVLY